MTNDKQKPAKPKVVVVVINYNSADYIERCVESVLGQNYSEIDLVFIDNNSDQEYGLKYMHDHFDREERIKIIANTENKGYARAANQGIKIALDRGADYVSITNPDLIYSSDYFSKAITRMEQDSKIASITGKVYKFDFKTNKPSDVIDSVGLLAFRNRRIIDDGQGLIDEGQFDQEKEVFGVSGACPIYRVEALEDVKIDDEYFDGDFFMYKEDTDLAWRFLLYGWKNLYYPKAVAYHGRGTGVYPRFSTREIFNHRKDLTKLQKQYSFRNQHLMQFKNETWGTLGRDLGPILFRKAMVPFYVLFFEPYLIKSYFQYLRLIPKMLKKRSRIMKGKRLSSKEMSEWFKKESDYL